MPYIEVLVYGAEPSNEQKRRLYQGLTSVVQDALKSSGEQVRITIQAWPGHNAYSGSRENKPGESRREEVAG